MFSIKLFCISFIVSFLFSCWFTRKTNMTLHQGMIIFGLSGLGTFCLTLIMKRWFIDQNIFITTLFAILSVIIFSAIIIIFRFYRDPERKIPEEKDVVVSPADGRIIYIREVLKGTIPEPIKGRSNIKLSELAKTDILNDDMYLIGIMMTLFDVHVNRAAIAGKIILNKHFLGKYISLKSNVAITENERNTIIIRTGSTLVGIIQIASKQVRKIVSYVAEGDDIKRGQRIGAILLGSQVDIILPKRKFFLTVKKDQQVYAGETIIAKSV